MQTTQHAVFVSKSLVSVKHLLICDLAYAVKLTGKSRTPLMSWHLSKWPQGDSSFLVLA